MAVCLQFGFMSVVSTCNKSWATFAVEMSVAKLMKVVYSTPWKSVFCLFSAIGNPTFVFVEPVEVLINRERERGKMEGQDDGVAEQSQQHDLRSILSCSDRDFLIRNNDDQVKIDNLKGKKVGLYFSASWCGPCRQFTPNLVEVYNELSPKGDFEIVFVSADEDDEAFKGYFSKMPWLAIPFFDSNTRDRLDELFKVMGIPYLVILDENGKVMTEDGVEFIQEYGVDAYPFTLERIKEIKDEEEKAKREQPLKFILASRSRDFVISADGNKVSISELEGNTIGLYFAQSSYKNCVKFTPKLVEVYEKLKAKGEKFEVVMIPFDDNEESFKQGFEKMPWLSLPFKDKSCVKLAGYFDIPTIPALVIIGPDGKTLQSDVVEAIEEHGTETYPFTPEKFLVLEKKIRQNGMHKHWNLSWCREISIL
ncbi:hypothetical protein RHMOL_Rhmol12G0137400 [Rhododendron molle]|uniref:Uncharacterized protein n=1 Tax=Rhododendron molle TaxID=49168 RepID=A0ACC0LIS4_RHOML|nr:hypothetical protein RHMOL_Rhmol12G0137400 [Rhododendron molle]